ncbi:response regulator [Leucobacter coleopterorum]|uniref:Response regulator n=1 Tax=Leucobacter coleopterorum TaxID=2714933 RepID=A0ABX6JYM5_9MICO|nr:response regulator [Leucobacter coleopterorum]QIM19422.1 response regulator [Leucobacter coleopterorum]
MNARPLALVVEDSDDQSALLRHLLERQGYEVFSAANAEVAVAAFVNIKPRIAILDLRLPGMSGTECARLVRERFPGCFIIVSSVLDVRDYPAADAALPKPITGADLRKLLEGLAP